MVEGTETIVATLSNEAVANGSAVLGTASTTTNVTEIDADVSFSVGSTASISEEAGATATFTVTLGGDALIGANTASVDIVASGTATSGTDYDNFVAALVAAAGATAGVTFDGVDTLTFGASFNGGTGTGAFAFTVDAVDDAVVEGTETIVATLSNEAVANGSAALGTASTTTNVTEVDADVTFGVGSTASISEDAAATATFTVTLGGDALIGANTASVDIVATGTATSGTDYDNFVAALVAAAGATAGVTFDGVDTLTFDSTFNGGTGTGAFAFTVDAVDDAVVEGTETIVATLSNEAVANGSAALGTASTTTNVTEVDADMTFGVASTVAISEDAAAAATFTVTLGGDALIGANTASVDIAASGTATSGTDYDNFVAALVATAGATAGVTFDGVDTLTFGASFNGGTGTGAFAFTVNAIDDAVVEGTETIVATLSNEAVTSGSAVLGTASTTTNVTEVDADVTFGVGSTASISEEAGATATFTVTLGGDLLVGANTASVDIVASGTATSGTDYDNFVAALVAAAGVTPGVTFDGVDTLTFDASFNGGTGTGAFAFTVAAIDDAVVEGTETIVATLSNEAVANGSAVLGTASTTTNVTEIDADVSFSVGSTASISEEAGATATFTVTLGGDALIGANTASVDIVASGTATSGTDYDNFVAALVAAAGATAGVTFDGVDTLTFGASFNGGTGTGAFAFTVDAVDDAVVEGTETIVATLSNEAVANGSAALGTASTTTNVTEVDADVTFGVGSTASISEDAAATATFTVTLGGDALIGANTASVDIVASGTAVSGTDYDNFVAALVATAGATAGVTFDGVDTLTFDSALNGGTGTGAFVFTVDAIDDSTLEPLETIIATLSNESVVNGSVVLGVASTTTNITDADTALVSIAATTPASEPGTDGQFTVTMTNPSATNTVLSYSIGGTASSGADYTALSGTVTILAGATTATIDVPVLDDLVDEVLETVVVTLTGVTAGDADVSGRTCASGSGDGEHHR